MDKYLFTDGTSGVKEAHSKDELLSLMESSPAPGKARVWIFSSNEWISCSSYLKQAPGSVKKEPVRIAPGEEGPAGARKKNHPWLRKTLLVCGVLAGALMVFNFTSAKWEKAAPLKVNASRPANVPVMDLDSLISEIELLRGRALDKSTRYNLRLRNNWPDHILLQLTAEKETKGNTSRFYNVSISIDNATGFPLDRAEVKLQTWKNGKAAIADTLQFGNIRYDKLLVRQLGGSFRCDSISVSFRAIRAGSFNFCYAAELKNNSGNYNDRWFCRDGKPSE